MSDEVSSMVLWSNATEATFRLVEIVWRDKYLSRQVRENKLE